MDILKQADGSKFRVLLIEDDRNIGRLIYVNLTRAELAFHYTADGAAGLAALKQFNPHLVLLDLMMPGMDGYEVCAAIRAGSMVPIVVVTGTDEEENLLRVFKAGADDYILKPFSIAVLVSRVQAHLRRTYVYHPGNNPDTAVPARAAPPANPSGLPAGWITCDSCGYAGPSERFLQLDGRGRRTLTCPHCHQATSVTFVVS